MPLVAAARAAARVAALSALHHLDGSFIIASNHQSHADTSIIIAALPRAVRRRLVVAAASDLFFSSRVRATLRRARLQRDPDRATPHRAAQRQPGAGAARRGAGGCSSTPRATAPRTAGSSSSRAVRPTSRTRPAPPSCPCYLENTSYVLPRLFAKVVGRLAPPRARLRTPVTVTFGPAILPLEGETTRRLGKRVEAAVAHLGRDVAGDPLADGDRSTD